jgi:hypothetical protein
MERSVWLPWAWGAGAVVCGFLLCLLQPWRRQFRTARIACRENAWLWAVPVLAAAAEFFWQWSPPAGNAESLLHEAGLLTGDSLAMVLTWIMRGDVLAMVLAAAFLANSAGLRRGLWRGLEATFPGGWLRVLQLALLASATAALGMPAVRFGAGGESGRLAVKLMASLWTSTAATLLMCWLILQFEAICRAPLNAAKIRWVEMTGQFTVRLWLPILAGSVAFPLMDAAGPELRGVLRVYAWPLAALLGWFPLTALPSSGAGEIHSVIGTALRRWGAGLLPFTGWLAVAGTHFFAFQLLSGWAMAFCPDGSWWRSGAALLFNSAWAALAVWMLGAWVCIQVDRMPFVKKDARALRHSAI